MKDDSTSNPPSTPNSPPTPARNIMAHETLNRVETRFYSDLCQAICRLEIRRFLRHMNSINSSLRQPRERQVQNKK